jgi:hypothetical protein
MTIETKQLINGLLVCLSVAAVIYGLFGNWRELVLTAIG